MGRRGPERCRRCGADPIGCECSEGFLTRSEERNNRRGGTFNSTTFPSVPQRDDPSITNDYFNGPGDGGNHGHVKYRNNPDGTTDYFYARDVEGNEYDV